MPFASHVPAQLSVSSAFLTEVQVPPAIGQVWQVPVQSLALQQALLAMHDVPHGLKPVAHPMYLHALAEVSHWPAIPFIVGQSASAQQPDCGTHLLPHFRWVPQSNPHCVPLQVAVPPVGGTHGSHEAPQLLIELLATHAPRQACIPVAQLTLFDPAAPVEPVPAAPAAPAVPVADVPALPPRPPAPAAAAGTTPATTAGPGAGATGATAAAAAPLPPRPPAPVPAPLPPFPDAGLLPPPLTPAVAPALPAVFTAPVPPRPPVAPFAAAPPAPLPASDGRWTIASFPLPPPSSCCISGFAQPAPARPATRATANNGG